MHFVYIIYSSAFNKYYIGETIDFSKRLEEHNSSAFIKSSTTFTDDWQLSILILFKVRDRASARKVEQYIKSMKSKKFIERLINDAVFAEGFIKEMKKKYNIDITKD